MIIRNCVDNFCHNYYLFDYELWRKKMMDLYESDRQPLMSNRIKIMVKVVKQRLCL